MKSRLSRWMAALVTVSWLAGSAAHSAPKRYDPDPESCQMDAIRKTFRANLQPWEDQPEVVQARLRQLRAAMTLDTLRDCQSKGLLSPAQVQSLTNELGLSPPAAGSDQSPARP